jgi:squalene synthase HpnD
MTLSAAPGGSSEASKALDAESLDHVRRVVARSGSSFAAGMRILPRPRREAMFAIYAFCREVDDVADGPAPAEAKLAQLQAWRDEIEHLYAGRPSRPTTRALLRPIAEYNLPQAEFLEVLQGMESDARGSLSAPSLAELRTYCRQVAGAVGLLSIRVFGVTDSTAERFALSLGEALQFTNILRDLSEDAERGRLYLPAELLKDAGIAARDPVQVLADPRIAEACRALGQMAAADFEEAEALSQRLDRRKLRPALLMMAVYRRLLTRLEGAGWQPQTEPVGLTRGEKLWIFLRHGLA